MATSQMKIGYHRIVEMKTGLKALQSPCVATGIFLLLRNGYK